MPLTTSFNFTQISSLPLPPPPTTQTPSSARPPESPSEILTRGHTTALSMLHSPELMISLNPLVQHYTRISPTDPSQSHQLIDLARLAPEFNVRLAPENPHCESLEDSKNGEFVHYEIIDRFNLGFGFGKQLTYKACFRPLYSEDTTVTTTTTTTTATSDTTTPTIPTAPSPSPTTTTSIGLETLSDPGNTVLLVGKWTLTTDTQNPDSITLTETVDVRSNTLLAWFVRGQLETAHAALHKEFAVRFARAMVEGDPGRGRDERGGRSWGEVSAAGDSREVKGLKRVGTGESGVGSLKS